MNYKKEKRKLNKMIRNINKNLQTDVFKDRFYIKVHRQDKSRNSLCYLCEVVDTKNPIECPFLTNYCWFNKVSEYELKSLLNHVIVQSDFWRDYNETDA